VAKRVVKKNDTAGDRAQSKIDAEEDWAREDEQVSEPEKDSEAEKKEATKPEPKRDKKEKPAASSNKRKREDVLDSTSRTPAKSTASKRTQAAKRRITKELAFVADESESEDEQPPQKRKKVNSKITVKPKEDRLPTKKNKKSPKLNIKGPVVADIKSNDFLKAHAHLSFHDKIAAALTYNNTHTSIRTDPVPLQQDNRKPKRSQDDVDERNGSTYVPKKLKIGGKGPVAEKKKNPHEVRSNAQLRALARKNNTIKGILDDIEKSSQ
jgi:hypothetical protein